LGVGGFVSDPAPDDQWHRLSLEDRVLSRATVRHGLRQVEVALLAVPMSGNAKEAATQLGRLFV